MDLDSEVQYIKGIGPQRFQGFKKLGINKVSDLLLFFPIQYQDRTLITPIEESFSIPQVCIFGK